MKFTTLLIILCLWGRGASAQQSLSDSLKARLAGPLPDTARVLLLDHLGRSLMYSRPFDAMQFAQQGLQLAREISFSRGEARVLNRIGAILRITGNYDKALEAHLASVQVAEATNDTDALARTYNNIGVLYSERKDSRRAITYYQKTRTLAGQLGDYDLMRIALSNLGTDYALLNQLDSALIYTRTAYDLTMRLGASDAQVDLINIGNIYKRLGKYPLALSFYRKSIPASVAVENERTLGQTYLEMAEVFQKTYQPDSAVFYAQQALELAQRATHPVGILGASKLLSTLFEKTDPQQALIYFKRATVAKDSLESAEKVRSFQNIEFLEKLRQQDVQQAQEAYRTRMIMYGLLGIIVVFMVVAVLLYRTNRHKQQANVLLSQQRDEINQQRDIAEKTLAELQATQAQLIQREKLASLGELTAGIAHEIQNPLNFVNNFSEVSTELVDELREEARAGRAGEVLVLADDLSQNLQKITHHGKRAGAIVKNMLEHSRASTGERTPTDLNALVSEYLQLAYQGLRPAVAAGSDDRAVCTLVTDLDPALGTVEGVAQDLSRVLLNLFNNAFYAVQDRAKHLQAGSSYVPMVRVSTRRKDGWVTIRVSDNGTGIPETIREKIFQPFFTTKPLGKGTGLGLSLSYDIITKGHGGELSVVSRDSEDTEFLIRLPDKEGGRPKRM